MSRCAITADAARRTLDRLQAQLVAEISAPEGVG
jgi:hypothetical protein